MIILIGLVTTAMKNLNKYDIWNDWSSKSKNYNNNNNRDIWKYKEGRIDIHFLISV